MCRRSSVACFLSALLTAMMVPGHAEPVAHAAETAAIEALADALVVESLERNAELKGVQATVAQRMAALDVARAHFLPAIDVLMRYSRADGGRQIDLPVGDLLNPVYSTLNKLLAAQGHPAQFPQIKNESIALLRPEEQEAFVRLTQPLFDLRLTAGVRGRTAELRAETEGLQAFRSRLARDVRQAWYRWLRARQSLGILDATVELAATNLRINESLSRNGKITHDLVLRAEADLLEIEESRLAVRNGITLAQAYVNLLRNRPQDTALPETSVSDRDVDLARQRLAQRFGSAALARGTLQELAARQRYELARLDAALAAAQAGEDLARASFSPQVALAVDAGAQGGDLEFDSDSPFVLASVVLRFNVFNGGADLAALNQARAVSAELHAARDQVAQSIDLEVLDALQIFEVAYVSLRTAEKRVAAAEGAFTIAEKKRDLGQINQTEFIDARRALTDAQLNRNLTRFAALSQLAALEYAVGGPTPAEEEP